jgi:hypothetical protein
MVMGCAATGSEPNLPSFSGVETAHWLVQVSEPVGRDDLLPAFEESARSYGCNTSRIGEGSSQNIHGEMRSHYGVSAACDEGTIALITLVGGRASIGCAKPTTAMACDQLLRNISQAR